MKLTPLKLTAVFTLISTAVLLLNLWLLDFSHLGIPEYIFEPAIKVHTILVLLFFILVLLFFQKQLLKAVPQMEIWKLIGLSVIVIAASLVIYELIKQLVIFKKDSFEDPVSTLMALLSITVCTTLIAASIALDLKKIKGIWRQVPTLLLLVLLTLIKLYAPHWGW